MPSTPQALRIPSFQAPAIAVAALHLSVAALALALAACGKSPETPAAGQAPPPGAGAGLPVTVIAVAPQRIPNLIEAVGQTEGSKDIEVRARVSGILERTLYAEGDRVRAGAPLFQIDRVPFENALAQARAALAQERARLEQVQRESTRLKQLVDQRAISQREYDDATTAVKTSQALIAAAEARVKDAELNLSYTGVTAPIAGVSGRAQRSIGSLVTAGTDSALLTTIAQSDPIWVRFSVTETEHAQLKGAGRKAEVKLILPDGSVYPGTGRLNFTASTVDTRLGTVGLRAEIPNPAQALLPGQFVRVRVAYGEFDAILVPQVAVVQNDQGRFVWVVGADGKAGLRPVEAANWVGSDWLIRKGLAAGDRVVIDNLIKLRPGTPVQATLKGAAGVAGPGAAAAAGAGGSAAAGVAPGAAGKTAADNGGADKPAPDAAKRAAAAPASADKAATPAKSN